MARLKQSLLAVSFAVMLFSGCAAITPVRKVWQPWSRVIGTNHTISLQSKLNITVVGESEPLNGQEDLLQTDIKQKLISQLNRRGYEI